MQDSTKGLLALAFLGGGYLLIKRRRTAKSNLGSARSRSRIYERRSNPKVRIRDSDGRTTVAGLHYQDWRSILNLASIEAHQSLDEAKAKDQTRGKDEEAQQYYRRLLKVLDALNNQTSIAIEATHPKRTTKLTRAERWRNVKEERKERLFMDNFMKNAHQMVKDRQKKS